MSTLSKRPSSVQNDSDGDDTASLRSMALTDEARQEKPAASGETDTLDTTKPEMNTLNASNHIPDKHKALLDALGDTTATTNKFQDDQDDEDTQEDIPLSPPNPPSLLPTTVHAVSSSSSLQIATETDSSLNPISPISALSKSPNTPFAAFQSAGFPSAPLSAGAMSSIPSAASNAPFLARSPSPQPKDPETYGIMKETDGSTSALRDVRDHRPGTSPPLDTASISSESQRKLRPESVLMPLTRDPLILGLALVDFDHAVGPRIEFSQGKLLEEDEEIVKILPFLALPDGAHLNQEDYSYFHLNPAKPGSSTIFAISCNRQIPASELLVKSEVVTRSTVQKAVVILASKPVFGPIRDKLGVVTRAFFNQRDFTEMDILVDFYSTLENSLRTQLTESGFYMGTSIRELLHAFRHRTLTLVKALMLQRKIVFFGHPVERLCTYQYSLVSLVPGLLQTLEDCGDPNLARRAPTLKKPSELRTSDRQSMMEFMGLPLDIFGKDSFFQPYLPLQQIDMLSAQSCLCGSTNNIVTQHKDIDLLVNIETSQIEYRTPHVERMVALTAADRRWIDDLVKDVNDTWNEQDPTRPTGMQFKGSDDYLRTKFEEYISSALSSIKYHNYRLTDGQSVLTTGEPNTSWEDYGELFLSAFQTTNAFAVWDRITDLVLFDIIEPKHPCEERPNIVSDIGLRLQEGITDLHLDQQLAPTRQALSSAFAAGSTGFFKAVEGVRGGVNQIVAQRQASSGGLGLPSFSNPFANNSTTATSATSPDVTSPPPPPSSFNPPSGEKKLRPLSLASMASVSSATSTNEAAPSRASATFSTWGSSVGSFLSNKASRLRESVSSVTSTPANLEQKSLAPSASSTSPPTPQSSSSAAPPKPDVATGPAQ